MPKDNYMRAIKRGTGEIAGNNYESHLYEGYGPGSIAVLVEVLTDNKNRTAGEIRSVFQRNGGHLAELGSVSWMFERKGIIDIVAKEFITEDFLIENLLDYRIDTISCQDESS